MEVICIDDDYSADHLLFFDKYKIRYPLKDEIFTIREVVNHTIGKVGVKLEEIVNPLVPVRHSILGLINLEPTFNIKRFTTLLGDKITKKELETVKNNEQ